MHVAVIGAGASGLSAARNLLKNGFSCEVFERNEDIGGTWYYTEETGEDKYGFPVYSSMYSGLKTNLPKEVMGYSDYKITTPEDRSYLTQEEILAFFNKYTDDHNLRPHIKFLSPVIEVRPLLKNRWSVKILNLPTKIETVKEFDAVMVCSGHFNVGKCPDIPGRNTFKGQQIHSHEYRTPEPFNGKRVLIVGAGLSGLDITLILSKNAESVILSHRFGKIIPTEFASNVSLKPDVTLVTETGVQFCDGTTAEVDCIIYCTGYIYKFPFLHEDCKIIIDDDVYMKPLYKMMINIEYPTMCFIGIPFRACSIPMFDLQVRFYMEYLKGSMMLPSKEEMYDDTAADIEKRKKLGYSKKRYHLMNTPFVWDYYKALSDAAKVENIWSSITKLRLEGAREIEENLLTFRNDRYRIVDKDHFVKL